MKAVHLPPLSQEYQVPYRPSITFLDPPVLKCLQCQYQCSQCQHCHLQQEPHYDLQCHPVTRQVCSNIPTPVTNQDNCDTNIETICTTIMATKYVKWCSVTESGGRECSQYPVQKPVQKCAEVPQQSCVRSRLKKRCRSLTQNVCRNFVMSGLTRH